MFAPWFMVRSLPYLSLGTSRRSGGAAPWEGGSRPLLLLSRAPAAERTTPLRRLMWMNLSLMRYAHSFISSTLSWLSHFPDAPTDTRTCRYADTDAWIRKLFPYAQRRTRGCRIVHKHEQISCYFLRYILCVSYVETDLISKPANLLKPAHTNSASGEKQRNIQRHRRIQRH